MEEKMKETKEFISKEKIEELKQKYGQVYKSEIEFKDEEDNDRVIEVIFRKPNADDLDSFQTESQSSLSLARQNMFNSLVVYPEDKKKVMDEIGNYHGVYLQFVEELSPFLAMKAKVKNSKL